MWRLGSDTAFRCRWGRVCIGIPLETCSGDLGEGRKGFCRFLVWFWPRHCEFISGCRPWPFRSSIQFSFCVSLLPRPALMGSLRDESASLVILLPRGFRKCSLLLSSCWGTGTYWWHSHVRETTPGPQNLSPKPGFEWPAVFPLLAKKLSRIVSMCHPRFLSELFSCWLATGR